ncbi:MAG TPA: GNAT family N-acetyltransferase [Pseudogracilibacillus sp.]|nr:GNAT family N-acetyltransferase [Pseudogracilibacillus sp.]
MPVKIATSEKELALAYDIRKTVFVEEQNVPMEIEIDEHEEEAIHFICYYDDKVVGASRLRFVDHYGKLERICVLKPYRNKALGKKIIAKMEEEIVTRGYDTARLNAQSYAQDFYKKLGYVVISEEEFFDAGIAHVAMEKRLR